MNRLISRLSSCLLALGLALAGAALPGAPVHASEVPAPPQDAASVYDLDVVRSMHMRLARADFDTIQADATFSIEVPAQFWLEGELVNDPVSGLPVPDTYSILVRRKSATAVGTKVSYRVDFQGRRWHDLKKLSLENGDDNNVVSEGLAWLLHRRAATATYQPSLAAWCTVTMHVEDMVPVLGEDGLPLLDMWGQPLVQAVTEVLPQGVYLNVEFVDKYFLARRGMWDAATTWLYKQDDIGLPELKESPTGGDSPAWAALDYSPFRETRRSGKRVLNPTPSDAALEADLEARVDMDSMLRVGAINAFTDNPDELFNKGKNFHWVDRASGLRTYLPWDLDASIRSTTAGVYGTLSTTTGKRGKLVTTVTQHPYQQVILNHPTYRARYNALLLALLDGPLEPQAVGAQLELLRQVLREPLAADPHSKLGDLASIDATFEALSRWVAERASSVRAQVQANNLPAPR